MDKKPVWGIRIKPSVSSKGLTGGIRFDLEVGAFESGDNKDLDQFITSRQIRQIIEEKKLKKGKPIGYITTYADSANQVIHVPFYYPHFYSNVFFNAAPASFAEYRIIRFLQQRFSHCKIVATKGSHSRNTQIRRSGRKPGEALGLAKAAESTRKSAIQVIKTTNSQHNIRRR